MIIEKYITWFVIILLFCVGFILSETTNNSDRITRLEQQIIGDCNGNGSIIDDQMMKGGGE
jgi:hypothetical protein